MTFLVRVKEALGPSPPAHGSLNQDGLSRFILLGPHSNMAFRTSLLTFAVLAVSTLTSNAAPLTDAALRSELTDPGLPLSFSSKMRIARVPSCIALIRH